MPLHLDGLMPHQPAGVEWLLQPRPAATPPGSGMLAWDMRCCKTSTVTRAWENDPGIGPSLVLCPATARENWRREFLRFCIDPAYPPNVQVIKSRDDRVDPAADIVVANYDKLDSPEIAYALRNNCGRRWWNTLVLDEAHYLKGPNSARTRYVLGGGKKQQIPLKNYAGRVWELSGTFMPNHPAELWTHCRYLYPDAIMYRGRPMELWEFELHYCQLVQGQHGMRVVGGKNLAELKQRLAPYLNRLKYADVFGADKLPRMDTWPLDMETASGRRWPDLLELVATLSQRYGSVSDIESFDQKTLDAYLSCINCEHDALASLRHETGTLKAVAVSLLVREELQNGGPKTIVFAWHRDAIETLTKGLKAFNPAVVHGGVPAGTRRDAEVDRFNNDPACKVFIGQIVTAGQIIDLSAAQSIIFAEQSWSPGENAQASLRASGPRQRASVSVRHTYLPGSIDENVVRANARKTAMIVATLG